MSDTNTNTNTAARDTYLTASAAAVMAYPHGVPRPVADVCVDVARWQSRLVAGLDPGAIPIGEGGWPLSYEAAVVFFGEGVIPESALRCRSKSCRASGHRR